jgi:hypothetical protein
MESTEVRSQDLSRMQVGLVGYEKGNKMIIPKKATVFSEFHCPKYPDLSKITYKICIGRQITKTPGGGNLYFECAESCTEGEEVLNRFKDYKPEKKKTPNWNTKGCKENEKRKNKTCAVVDCVKCKTLLHAQVEYVIQLIYSEKQKRAIERLNLLLEEI